MSGLFGLFGRLVPLVDLVCLVGWSVWSITTVRLVSLVRFALLVRKTPPWFKSSFFSIFCLAYFSLIFGLTAGLRCVLLLALIFY